MRSAARRSILPALAALALLSSCITRIPEDVLDAQWCRDMEAGLARADARGQRNLRSAMAKHRCAEKIAAQSSGTPAGR